MGLIHKIWNGEVPLVKVYWIYGVLVGIVFTIFLFAIKDNPTTLVLLNILLIPYQILIFVGTWRSANNYPYRKLWANLAKVYIIVSAIYITIGIANMFKYYELNSSLSVSNILPSFSNENKKIGSDLKWKKVSESWWIEDIDFVPNKYGLINVWIKLESMDKAKKLGTDYSHTIASVVFSCNHNEFKFDVVYDIFNDSNVEDRLDLEAMEDLKNFLPVIENGKGLARSYALACNK